MNNSVNVVGELDRSIYQSPPLIIRDLRRDNTVAPIWSHIRNLHINQLVKVAVLLKKLYVCMIESFPINIISALGMTICAVQACIKLIPPGKSLH
jgi:hypothetical protein